MEFYLGMQFYKNLLSPILYTDGTALSSKSEWRNEKSSETKKTISNFSKHLKQILNMN